MYLKIKDIKQNEFKIQVKPSDTILKVKEKIKSKCAEKYNPKEQKLVYLGVILTDECTVEECEFDENDYVLLIHVPAVLKKGETIEDGSKENSTIDSDSTEEESSNDGNSKEEQEYNVETLNELVSMGYPKKMVKKALRASFNNAEVAIKYLVNGIPDEIERQLLNLSESSDADEISRKNPLATVIPNFNTFCTIMRNDPAKLSEIMSEISLQDHSVYQNIIENQHDFIELLNTEEFDVAGDNSKCIEIGPEEHEAIRRLESMGFESDIVIQAYRAFDSNEAAATEFLLELKN